MIKNLSIFTKLTDIKINILIIKYNYNINNLFKKFNYILYNFLKLNNIIKV